MLTDEDFERLRLIVREELGRARRGDPKDAEAMRGAVADREEVTAAEAAALLGWTAPGSPERAGATLARLGWRRVQRRRPYGKERERVYLAPEV